MSLNPTWPSGNIIVGRSEARIEQDSIKQKSLKDLSAEVQCIIYLTVLILEVDEPNLQPYAIGSNKCDLKPQLLADYL